MKNIIARIRGYLFVLRSKCTGRSVSIDSGLEMHCRLVILGEGKVTIGKNCVISGVAGDERQYVTIYTHSTKAVVSIGNDARLFGARISSKFHVNIGDDFLIEESGITDTDFHSISPIRGAPNESKEKCRVLIGNRVSVGARSAICKGVSIGDDVLVYPGSIVTRGVPAGSIVCGNPAKVVRQDTGALG